MASHFLGIFPEETHLLDAAKAYREAGFSIREVYSPFPIHGIEKLLDRKTTSRLTWACGAFAALGLLGALSFQYWATGVDWPINVGGRPLWSWPAFVPVAFEAMVLCAGLGTVATLFVVCKLLPGKDGDLNDVGITSDAFVILLDRNAPGFDPVKAEAIAAEFGARSTENRIDSDD
jgi:hypothetical protein